ncbi:F-box domain containing protein [Parasponia andersonii]|uniref:F-box domain containing protein n=1 Tax=Parasponia andersonii TaxID=3476 RepID=A0A2P5AGY7_PARAD|nr:F-box domain containing protein [Parasponia andersonii]
MAPSNKKRRLYYSSSLIVGEGGQYRDWSGLHTDLLEVILNKLSFHDISQFKAVCSSWSNLASTSRVVSSPWLMLPNLGHGCEYGSLLASPSLHNFSRFFSLVEKQHYKYSSKQWFQEGVDDDYDDYDFPEAWCVGSSHGWLVIMDHNASPLLLNPFSRRKIRLPLMKDVMFSDHLTVRDVQKSCISKAIVLFSEDKKDKNKTWVVVIYGFVSQKLAYCEIGDKSWTDLDGDQSLSYCDILGHNGRLYALSSSNTVEVWDLRSTDCGSFPAEVMNFVPESVLCLGLDDGKFSNDNYFGQSYLVESMGEFLLVTRIIGYYVDSDGELLDEADLLTDEDTHPLVCPYRTVAFRVHKTDLTGNKWDNVESLEDRALFLGGNESMSFSCSVFPECDRNSIYFTDDYWDGMNGDYLYGGHDNGVYSLEAKTFKPLPCFDFLGDGDNKVDPPPFWIVPSI